MSLTRKYLDNYGRWGPSLEDFLKSVGSYFPPKKPSREQIDESYHIYYAVDRQPSVTCSVLEDVLFIPQYPDKIMEICSHSLTMWHTRMIEPALRLLKIYTTTNHLFDHYFGFLCLQILVFGLRADICVRSQSLGMITDNVDPDNTDVFCYGTRITLQPDMIMSWSHGMDEQQQSFLHSILWKSRKNFFRVCTHVPKLRGWIVLFAAIWIRPDRFQLPRDLKRLNRLYNLMNRYNLSIKDEESYRMIEHILETIVIMIGKHGLGLIDLPPDPEDDEEAAVFRDKFARQLNGPEDDRFDRRAAPMLMGFILQHYFNSPKGLGPASSRHFFESMLARLWREIEVDRCLSDAQHRTETLDLAIVLFKGSASIFHAIETINSQRIQKERKSLDTFGISTYYADLLFKSKWIELVARVLVLATLAPNDVHTSEREESLLHGRLQAFLDHFDADCKFFQNQSNQVAEIFRPNYHDWEKMRDFWESKNNDPELGSKSTSLYSKVGAFWRRLGSVLGFSSRDRRCAFVGCFNTNDHHQGQISVRVCEGCLMATYCSKKCQKLDWDHCHFLQCRV